VITLVVGDTLVTLRPDKPFDATLRLDDAH
jgi:hypothetical protein